MEGRSPSGGPADIPQPPRAGRFLVKAHWGDSRREASRKLSTAIPGIREARNKEPRKVAEASCDRVALVRPVVLSARKGAR